jgi:cytoskeletal protein CcmA (bactofilin family)
MATIIKDSLTDHSPLDGTNDAINGAEVDANTDVISQILDGTTATDLATDSTVDFRFTSSRAGLRLIDTDNAGGAVHYGLDMEWDPGDGGQMTDGSSGVGMRFLMPDAADTQTAYARMYVLMRDDTADSDDAEFVFEAAVGGTLTTELLHMSQTNGIVFNDDSGDIDFRIEGANTANGFLLDAGQDAISLGGANVDGAAFTLNNLQSRTAITSVGSQLHIPAQTTNFDNSSGTIAIGAAMFIGIPTWTNASATLTMTHAASLYIQGVPVDSTNVTATNTPYALWVDAGETRLDGAVTSTGVITGSTLEATGDTASGDNAAIGYTSAEGLILTGQGSTSDVIVKNDADGTVFTVPTGTDDILFPDSAKAMWGASSDMQLYHDGSNSYITNAVGALKIATETSGIAVTIGHGTSEVTIADNLTVTGTLTLGSGAELTEAELEFLDGITAGTAAASKAMVLDSSADITGGRNITISGELDAATLDVSGNADIDGTLEADAITVNGTALSEYIADTTGAMFGSNTETGITVTYQDGDNTIDLALDAAQTVITSLLATDIKIGEDDQTKIDFETADEIHFYAANVEQVYLADNIFGPQSDSDVDLGTTGVRWKDAYVDSITVTGEVDGATLDISGNADIGGTLAVTGTSQFTGNVGIGVSPATTLHLSASVPKLRITDTGASGYMDLRGANSEFVFDLDPTAAQSTSRMAFAVDGATVMKIEAGILDMVATNNRIDLDDDNDTSIRARIDDVICFEAGSDSVMEIHNGKVGIGTGTAVPGTNLDINVTSDLEGIRIKADGDHRVMLKLDSDRSDAGLNLGEILFNWNETRVAKIMAVSGADTSDKDDAHLVFETSAATASAERMRITSAGTVNINDSTTNANMTVGLTINQGANDNQILTLKSSDVAAGTYLSSESDDFGWFKKVHSVGGGLTIYGKTDAEHDANSPSLWLRGISDDSFADATKTTSGRGIVEIISETHDSAGNGVAVGAELNIFTVRAGTDSGGSSTRFQVDEDGDIHAVNATITAYDDYDDALLCRAFDQQRTPQTLVKSKWDEFQRYNRDTLIDLGILGDDRGVEGDALVNVTQLQRLHNGAIVQAYHDRMDLKVRIDYQQEEIESLKKELRLLKG